jgi:hypothetical protein
MTVAALDLAFHRGCGRRFLITIEGEYLSMNIHETKKRPKKKPFNSISYTTGDISLNMNRFNQAMGSLEGSETGVGGCGALSEDAATLQEAKRYVRRYYIRPQNIFCSNKAEILKALIELDDNNCSVYTLNNLGDDKDVSRLMTSDIIYYYDNGILYDKNKVKVMDYDLSIKKEEDRKKFANVDNATEKEFKAEYEDRMTDATELEESFFNLDFDDYNVYGERLTEAKEHSCCICGEPIEGHGNNPEPYMSASEGQCCQGCNLKFVVPMRLDMSKEG